MPTDLLPTSLAISLSVMALLVVCVGFGTGSGLLLFLLRRRSSLARSSLLVVSLSLLSATLGYGLYTLDLLPFSRIWLMLGYTGLTVAASAVFMFCLYESDLLVRPAWPAWMLLAIEPLCMAVVITTADEHRLFFASPISDISRILPAYNFLGQAHVLYGFGLLALAFLALVQGVARRFRRSGWLTAPLMVGVPLPLVLGLLAMTGWWAIPDLVATLIGFALLVVLIMIADLRGHLLDIIPLPRDHAIDLMPDAWVMLDEENRVVDLNRAAESLLNRPLRKMLGAPVMEILGNSEALLPGQAGSLTDQRGSIRLGDTWRYFSIRSSVLPGPADVPSGRVMLWYDITERRRVEDARQQARDEMFVLLHSISSASSRALSLQEFLGESLEQIGYSFRSQMSAVFLGEPDTREQGLLRLGIAAQFGALERELPLLDELVEQPDLLERLVKGGEPLLLQAGEVASDGLILPDGLAFHSVILAPLVSENQMLGVLALGRRQPSGFGADELARLVVVSKELAVLILSDRRRHLAITLAERQRLLRDLHDSVTQKLYALVTLTEAAKAGMEAGSPDMPARVIDKIGENARQALKEMRLFLFEMQPLDLEREGLVSMLHQRLAAVEGRADIKASLTADDHISLTTERQVALYFAAQESLNNVLKHAHAKRVQVRISRRRGMIIMEIEDDGIGFDSAQVPEGGMGLKNIRERIVQVGGTCKFRSQPGAGTTITVTVPAEKISKRS